VSWAQHTRVTDKGPELVLIDDRFRANPPGEQLPRLARFSIHTLLDAGDAFWAPSEGQSLDALEHDLIRLSDVFGQGWAVYVLRTATKGRRVYFIYHSTQADLTKAFAALEAIHPDYSMEIEVMDDPQWLHYSSYLSG
jgi:hypothetical protein